MIRTLRFYFPFLLEVSLLTFFSKKASGGDDGIRTHDPLLAGQVLSQLSYTPIKVVVSSPYIVDICLLVGPSGLEPPTSCLSGTRSNLLSYEPLWLVSDLLSLELIFFNHGVDLSTP